MFFLRRLWRRWVRSDLWFWRRLRETRSFCRALQRDNEGLRRRIRQLESERAEMGQADYWYRRWDELRQRPAYFAQDVLLAQAYAERERALRELRVLRQLVAPRTPSGTARPGPESDSSALS